MAPRVVITAPESGSGKTIITAGIGMALSQRGLQVQPFKVGPDYIDPSYHHLATGRACRNLDAWMLSPEMVTRSFAYNSRGADLALIEGVMGLFDGAAATSNEGSTAHIAQLLNAPLVMVLPVRGMARSAAALVHGYHTFSTGTRLSGVILNRVGSEKHADLCRVAIEETTGVPVLGYLLRDEVFHLPERHLGLIPTQEAGTWREQLERVAAQVAATVDLDRLLEIAGRATEDLHPSDTLYEPLTSASYTLSRRPRIAVAQDEAFSFTYPENVELLREAGAEIVPFSPIRDHALPENTDGIILSGGFPELYAAPLSANAAMHIALRDAASRNVPIYAECGGFMYLTESITDGEGKTWAMVGALPGRSVMTKRVTLGYRVVESVGDTPLLAQGEQLRGHEFHYSVWEPPAAPMPSLYQHRHPATGERTDQTMGVQYGSICASYLHVHFLSKPEVAARFVAWCRG